jgi:hypothetical protein
MKHAAIALTFATFVAATPVSAASEVEPLPPASDRPTLVMPNDAYAAPLIVIVPVPEPRKNTGALNPYTPDPTKNTPGAEAKN